MGYIGLAVVKCDDYSMLCQFPRWSGIKPGDLVSVKDRADDFTVIAADTFSDDSRAYNFIMNTFSDQERPLPKITERIVFEKLQYEDDENEPMQG